MDGIVVHIVMKFGTNNMNIKRAKYFCNKEFESYILSNNKSSFYSEDYFSSNEKNYAGIDIAYCWIVCLLYYIDDTTPLLCLIYEK